ncbi:hypothetical protein GUJ93_ZPchr0001g31640 [Zizania palustris]|uniref:Uncharacterized protein n=1 Tax=Zizania palustris TaxID=103762 RepID=A0A8J5RWY4_ZIZPA|nr:hypothetical protein GUJ93_ZPchr0001g31640 [Zizania palustris]
MIKKSSPASPTSSAKYDGDRLPRLFAVGRGGRRPPIILGSNISMEVSPNDAENGEAAPASDEKPIEPTPEAAAEAPSARSPRCHPCFFEEVIIPMNTGKVRLC